MFDYLTVPRGLPATDVRAALLADYVASGARANPAALQGHLPARPAPAAPAAGALAARQAMHLHAMHLHASGPRVAAHRMGGPTSDL